MLADGTEPSVHNTRQGPIVVLTYAQSGADLLYEALTLHKELACTIGTGLLPLCNYAQQVWMKVDGRGEKTASPLAIRSSQAFAGTVITSILAAAGKSRLCEFAIIPARSAEAFGRLFPSARFICFHRACSDVIESTKRGYPWGLSPSWPGPPVPGYERDIVTTVAAYWKSATQALIEFEESHMESCMRLCYEDLTAQPLAVLGRVLSFAGVKHDDSFYEMIYSRTYQNLIEADAPDCGKGVPLESIPSQLYQEVNQLSERLGYFG